MSEGTQAEQGAVAQGQTAHRGDAAGVGGDALAGAVDVAGVGGDTLAGAAADTVGTAADDAGFEHLADLMERLEHMTIEGQRLTQARSARELLHLHARAQALQKEHDYFSAQCARGEADVSFGHAHNDSEALDRGYGLLRAYTEQLAVRQAPLARAWGDLTRALEEREFSSIDEGLAKAGEQACADGEFAALEREVAAYQEDFSTTYARCLEAETAGDG